MLLLGRDAKRLANTSQAAQDKGAMVWQRQISVTDQDVMTDALTEFNEVFPIGTVILAAGVKTGNKSGVEAPEQMSRIVKVNLQATMMNTQSALHLLRKNGGGQIVLFSSIAARAPQADLLSYSATIAGIRAYGFALRKALAGTGISVTVVSPGFVDTPMTDRHDGPTPMKMSAQRAAKIIAKGLKRRKSELIFPRALAVSVTLKSLLPVWLDDWIDARLSANIIPDPDEKAERQ